MRFSISFAVLAALGCGSLESANLPQPSAGTTRSELVVSNGYDLNGTALNGTALNGYDLNGTALNGTALNGYDLNGTKLNGTALNGYDLNGLRLASTLAAVRLVGVEMNGAPLSYAWLEGGELRAQQWATSAILAGADLVGAVLDGERGDGSLMKLRIQSAIYGSAIDGSAIDGGTIDGSAIDGGTIGGSAIDGGTIDPWAGIWRYGFLHQQTDGTWAAVCPLGGLAVVVSGRWNYQEGVPGGGAFTADPSVFTIGCPSSAVSKCVRLGYRPWTQFETIPGSELHAACVRAIRADYCGDGRSHTTNGRVINIYDGLGVQADTEEWPIEAEWTPAGINCVSPFARDNIPINTCAPARNLKSCGDRLNFQTGTRIMTETPAQAAPPAFR